MSPIGKVVLCGKADVAMIVRIVLVVIVVLVMIATIAGQVERILGVIMTRTSQTKGSVRAGQARSCKPN